MGIALLRVDERLIHGQVVIAWGNHLRSRRYVVFDDELASSDWEQDLYGLAVPPNAEARFHRIAEAPEILAELRTDPAVSVVLFRNLASAVALPAEAWEEGDALNLGMLHHKAGTSEVRSYLHLDRRRPGCRSHAGGTRSPGLRPRSTVVEFCFGGRGAGEEAQGIVGRRRRLVMEVAALLALAFAAGVDGTAFGQFMISRPLVSGVLSGVIVGDPVLGTAVGALLEVYHLPAIPVGGGRYPEPGPAAVVGVFAGGLVGPPPGGGGGGGRGSTPPPPAGRCSRHHSHGGPVRPGLQPHGRLGSGEDQSRQCPVAARSRRNGPEPLPVRGALGRGFPLGPTGGWDRRTGHDRGRGAGALPGAVAPESGGDMGIAPTDRVHSPRISTFRAGRPAAGRLVDGRGPRGGVPAGGGGMSRLPAGLRARVLARCLLIQAAWNPRTMLGHGVALRVGPRPTTGGQPGFSRTPSWVAISSTSMPIHICPPWPSERWLGWKWTGPTRSAFVAFKTAVRGPLGAIGDQLIWVGWLPRPVPCGADLDCPRRARPPGRPGLFSACTMQGMGT